MRAELAPPGEHCGELFSGLPIIAGYRGGARCGRCCRHLPGAVHAQFVEHPRAGPQIRGQAFRQARDVEEDISSAIVRPQESEAFGFEVGHHRSRLFAGGRFSAGVAGLGGSLRRPAAFVADSLLDQCEIGFGPIRDGCVSAGHLEVRIALPGLFK